MRQNREGVENGHRWGMGPKRCLVRRHSHFVENSEGRGGQAVEGGLLEGAVGGMKR